MAGQRSKIRLYSMEFHRKCQDASEGAGSLFRPELLLPSATSIYSAFCRLTRASSPPSSQIAPSHKHFPSHHSTIRHSIHPSWRASHLNFRYSFSPSLPLTMRLLSSAHTDHPPGRDQPASRAHHQHSLQQQRDFLTRTDLKLLGRS